MPDSFVRGADGSFLPELATSGNQLKNSNANIENPLMTLKKAEVNKGYGASPVILYHRLMLLPI